MDGEPKTGHGRAGDAGGSQNCNLIPACDAGGDDAYTACGDLGLQDRVAGADESFRREELLP
jgi:hypothetical protein